MTNDCVKPSQTHLLQCQFMLRVEFEQLVSDALDELPSKFQKKLDNVMVVVEDWPTFGQLRKVGLPQGMTLFGLYEGIPRTKRGQGYTFVLPDRITIFQKPIEWFRRTPDAIREQVKKTVLHEIGHYFGMSEEELRTKT